MDGALHLAAVAEVGGVHHAFAATLVALLKDLLVERADIHLGGAACVRLQIRLQGEDVSLAEIAGGGNAHTIHIHLFADRAVVAQNLHVVALVDGGAEQIQAVLLNGVVPLQTRRNALCDAGVAVAAVGIFVDAELRGVGVLLTVRLNGRIDRLVDARGKTEKLRLLFKGIKAVFFPDLLPLQEILVHHKAHGDIVVVAEQLDAAGAGDLRQIIGVVHAAGTGDQVFEVHEHVGDRRIFLVDIAVACLPAVHAKVLIEQRHALVRHGVEHRQAVVVVERAVVERLGALGLGTPQLGRVLLLLFHIIDDRLGIALAARIAVHAGHGRDVHAEVARVAALRDRDHQQRNRHCLQRHDALGVEHHQNRDQQQQHRHGHKRRRHPAHAVGSGMPLDREHVEHALVVGALAVGILGAGEVKLHQQHRKAQHSRRQRVQQLCLANNRKGVEAQHNHHKADEIAKAVIDHVREVEAVPDKVKLADDKAEEHEQDQAHTRELFSELDLLGGQAEEHEENRDRTAGDIGHGVDFLVGGDGKVHQIAGDAFESLEHADQVIAAADIRCKFLRKGAAARMGILQRKERRQHKKGGQTDAQNRKHAEFEQVGGKSAHSVPARDMVADKNQQDKNAGEKADVVVGDQRQRQHDGVEPEAVLGEQLHGAQRDQRRDADRVEPDGVPVVAHKKGAERKADAENHQRGVVAPENAFEEKRHKGAGKRDLDRDREHQKLAQPIGRDKQGQEVHRACKVVGHQRKIVGAGAYRPSPKQAFAVLELVLKIRQKGIILVPQVGHEDLLVRLSERRHIHQTERRQHQRQRNQKRYPHIQVALCERRQPLRDRLWLT